MLRLILATLGAFSCAAMQYAVAQEVTLRAVSAFQEGTAFAKPFDDFIKRVNETGKGVIKINYIGGPRAMPPLEVGNAVKSGVIDVANVTSNFYSNLMPEAQALQLSTRPIDELRKNGGWDLLNKLHQEKMNSWYLGSHGWGFRYHLYLTKEMPGMDLKGYTIRVTPVYRPFFSALGANLVNIAPGEVFTALERGVIQGYGWPVVGIFDLGGWQDKTKYRVEPGFYSVEVALLVNLPKWNSLTAAQKKVLTDAALEMEADQRKNNPAYVQGEIERQDKQGIKAITFSGDDKVKWEKMARDTYWAELEKAAPAEVKKLRPLLADD